MKRLTIIFMFIAIIIIPVFLIPTQLGLVFYKENSTKMAAYLPVKDGEMFDIIWTHSIHLTDVIERYTITAENDMKQYEIIYEQFGIGMPSNAEEGETFVYEDGKYHVKDLDNIFPSMNIRNGKTVSQHRLVWKTSDSKDHQIYFNDYFEPGAWFKVKVEKLSLFQAWKGVKIHD